MLWQMNFAKQTLPAGFGFERIFSMVLSAFGTAVLCLLAVEPLVFMPAEDAVILWAYSRNLALQGAISYFAGGPHTEGATDFAWMVAVAGAIRCRVDPQIFTAVLNVVCLAMTSVLLVRLADLRVTWLRVFTVAGAAGCMPQIFAAASGFATLPDVLLLTAIAYWTSRRAEGPVALLALLFCLFRPDGVVMVLPLFLCMLIKSPRKGRTALHFLLLFLLPGALYFGWRLYYFHEWLPLPMLVKSDAARFFGIFVPGSVRTSLVFLTFALLLIGMVWHATRHSFKGREFVISLLIVPTAFYWCVRLDQNIGFRFFYFLPLCASIVLALNWHGLRERRAFVLKLGLLAWLVLLAMPLRRELRTFLDLQSWNLRDIATDLRPIGHSGSLLSSEAGILPYYSGWRSVDPWGLDTAEFAHRFFQPADIARQAPTLIHLHPDLGQGCIARADWHPPYRERSWAGLTKNILSGAGKTEYELWQTSYGSERYRRRKHWSYGEGDVSCWLIRRGTLEEDRIAAVLERHHAVKVY